MVLGLQCPEKERRPRERELETKEQKKRKKERWCYLQVKSGQLRNPMNPTNRKQKAEKREEG